MQARPYSRRLSSAATRALLRLAARLWLLHHPAPENPWQSGNEFVIAAQAAYVKTLAA